jgi:hypothetical protein
MATASSPAPHPVFHALRVAAACTLCLFAVAWWRLEHANLAVWTSYMVTSKYPLSVFQSGLERTIGRGAGILAAVALVAVFPDAVFARILVETVLLFFFFYLFLSGRFAYTLINAALYLAVLVEMGRTQPEAVASQGWQMFLAVLVGSLVSDLVMWLSFGERSLEIQVPPTPLWPLRPDWVSHALMMIVTIHVTLITCRFAELPIDQSVISVMMLTAAADVQALLLKGELRVGGALLAAAWALGSFILLRYVPALTILAALLFAGIYLATYLSRTLGKYAYLGVQMGLVIPLLIVVPAHEFGSLGAAVLRLEGVLISLVSSVVVAGLWPAFPPPTDSTATPGTGGSHG